MSDLEVMNLSKLYYETRIAPAVSEIKKKLHDVEGSTKTTLASAQDDAVRSDPGIPQPAREDRRYREVSDFQRC